MTKKQMAILVGAILGTLLLILAIGGGILFYFTQNDKEVILPSNLDIQNGTMIECDSEEECQNLMEQQFPGGTSGVIDCDSEEECAELFGGEMPGNTIMLDCDTPEECEQEIKKLDEQFNN